MKYASAKNPQSLIDNPFAKDLFVKVSVFDAEMQYSLQEIVMQVAQQFMVGNLILI